MENTKLKIAVSTRALFDLEEEKKILNELISVNMHFYQQMKDERLDSLPFFSDDDYDEDYDDDYDEDEEEEIGHSFLDTLEIMADFQIDTDEKVKEVYNVLRDKADEQQIKIVLGTILFDEIIDMLENKEFSKRESYLKKLEELLEEDEWD